MTIPKPIVDQFEAYAYKHYESARMSAMLQGAKAKALLTPKQYFARDAKGEYVNSGASMLWLGWRMCLDAMAPTLEAATLWTRWGDIQDRAAAELPKGYEITWSISSAQAEHEGAGLVEMGVLDPDCNDVQHQDPADMESPGLFVRMFECALQAAKEDHARGLN